MADILSPQTFFVWQRTVFPLIRSTFAAHFFSKSVITMKRLTVFICLLSAGMMWMPVVASAENHRALATAAGPDDGVISGVVEDAAGPMIGATVKVAGTSIGAVTDLDGRFTLKCKTGDELEVSYVGYTTVKVKARPSMKIVMVEDKTQLSEVVVTALGVKRERKALG